MGSRSGVEWTTYIEKSADETVNNSATLQDDDHLVLPVAANGVYFFEATLFYSTNATADLKLGWSVPAGATMVWGRGHAASSGAAGFHTANASGSVTALPTQASTIDVAGGASPPYMFFTAGLITVSSTAGNATLQWAQNTADVSDTKVLKGSFIRFRRTA